MTSTKQQDIARAVLGELPVPDLKHLSDDQTRGRACVWDRSEELPDGTGVDLGERMSPHAGTTSRMRWFPRACPTHAAENALAALFDHCTKQCEECRRSDVESGCEVGRILVRLVLRKGRI